MKRQVKKETDIVTLQTFTQRIRNELNHADLDSADGGEHNMTNELDTIDELSTTGDMKRSNPSSQVAPAKRKYNVSRSMWRKAKSIIRRSYVFTSESKRLMVAALREVGFQVSVATGEADLHAARLQGPVNIISSDSDSLFHRSTDLWIIPRIRGSKDKTTMYGCVVAKVDVIKNLELSNDALTVLAIVSGNDYVDNIWGVGIRSSHKLLQTIEAEVNDQRSTYELLQTYVVRIESEQVQTVEYFTPAYRIFAEHLETIIPDILNSSAHVRKLAVEQFQQVRAERKARVKDETGIADNLSHRFAQTNRFRVLEQKQTSRRYSYKTVDLMEPRF